MDWLHNLYAKEANRTSEVVQIIGFKAGTVMRGTVEDEPRVHEYLESKSPVRNPSKNPTITIKRTRRRANVRYILR